jgi:hypothetical protein
MNDRLTSLKASKEEIMRRKYRPVYGDFAIPVEPPAKRATTCTREQANTFWEIPPKKLWLYIQENYPDVADRINHRIERSKEIKMRKREMNRNDRNLLAIKKEKDYESINDTEDFEYTYNDCNDDLSDIETDQYSD